MSKWQNRPLDGVYPVKFIDCIHVRIREGQVANRPIIESVNARNRKAVKARGHFLTEQAALKCVPGCHES
jgi:transposase-like protein